MVPVGQGTFFFLVLHAASAARVHLHEHNEIGKIQAHDETLDLGEEWTDDSGDCSWAKLDTSTGWKCETLKAFSGGMQGNTKLVKLFPPNGGVPFKAVLKEMNSNQNPMGLNSLENERKVAGYLMERGFKDMPEYYLSLRAKPEFMKYTHSENMTLAEKANCDHKRLSGGMCAINPLWDECNGRRGNIDTTVEIPLSQIRSKGLRCPDTQLLAMEFLDGYKDLKGLQAKLSTESSFQREVRAAALFVAYDRMNKAGVSHCDFNPGNAMFKIDDPRVAKIIDFGLARLHDYPTGACRGNLEDIGRPGFLWLSLYRGQRDEMEFRQNDKKAGPLALGRNSPFQTPSGNEMLPFSMMKGKFAHQGGNQPWNRETRQNWPAIVAYAKVLIAEAGGEASGDVPRPPAFNDDAETTLSSRTTTTTKVEPDSGEDMQQKPSSVSDGDDFGSGSSATPKCQRVFADRSYVCKLTLYDTTRCSVNVQCSNGKVVKMDNLSRADTFEGRIAVDNCNRCKII